MCLALDTFGGTSGYSEMKFLGKHKLSNKTFPEVKATQYLQDS